VKLSKSEWILKPGAYAQIVDTATFAEAQSILESRTVNQLDDDMLNRLRKLLSVKRRLSLRLIESDLDTPSPSTYRSRFGSLRRAYELIGYGKPEQFGPVDLRARTMALRGQVMAELAAMSPGKVTIVTRGGRWRTRLRLSNRLIISVLVARCFRAWKHTIRWQIDPVHRESKHVTLLIRLDEDNKSILDFHVLPRIDRKARFRISKNDLWLQQGQRLHELSKFCECAERVSRRK
jgi:hypothetical protein